MSELTYRIRFIETLRQQKSLYISIRALYRLLRRAPIEALRQLLPRTQMWGLPRGFYSGVQAVRSGKVPGKVLVEYQTPPHFGDNTLVRLSRLEQDKNQPWPIFWLCQKKAYLSGETLCLRDREGRLLAESTFSQTGFEVDPAYSHFAGAPQLRVQGNATSIVSYWGGGGYWHWIMDSISRLCLLPEFPPDTQVIVPPLKAWQRWFLKEMGLENRLIETKAKAVWVENYYFASPTSMTGCYNPIAMQFLRGQFLPKAATTGNKPRRFYIIREGFTRGARNEKEIRAFFQHRGWGLVAPETLSIPEQIELFAKAEAVVGLHGSALTNLLWASPGCKVIELNSANFLLGSFEVIARVLDLHHDFLICPGDHRSYIDVDLAALEKKLAAAGV